MNEPYRLGLTGGIGSGKSTVAHILAESGASVIDADALSRSLTASGGLAIPDIVTAFGPQAIDALGAMDRNVMRALVFQDPSARQRLENIIHPLVAQLVAQAVQHAQAQGVQLLVLDLPLLVESGRWRPQLDAVLVVDCEESSQIQRVIARNGLNAAAVKKIIVAQASRAQRRAASDWVIYNEGIDLAVLREEVLSISAQLPL